MIYTKLTRLAMQIAYRAHHGQVDKSQIPYIYHPIHLAEQMTDEYTTCVALLHDVVEDTEVTLEELANDFPTEVVDAIGLMTHDPAVPYLEYVRQIGQNPIARRVKLADLKHNMDITRIDTPDAKALSRINDKYKKALQILQQEE